MQKSGPTDAPVDVRRVVVGVVAASGAIAVGVLIPQSPALVLVLFAALAYGLTLTINYRWLALVIIAVQPAALIVPYLPGRPFLWEACAMVAWPSLVGAFLVNRQRLQTLRLDATEIYALLSLLLYLVILVVLMFSRGVGFRVFGGGGQMGGRFYVQQVILAIVPFLLLAASPASRSLLWAMVAGWVLSCTYLISDFALAWGGPRFYPLLRFFELPTDAVNFFLNSDATGVKRYQSLWFVGSALVAAACTWMPLGRAFGTRIWLGLPLIGGGFFLGLLSGHRTALMHTGFSLLLLAFFQRFWNPLRTVAAALAGSAALAALYVAAPSLPLSVQRSLSILPGIDVSAEASADAFATARDRLEIFSLGLRDLPDYWLLGRGFGLERADGLPSPSGADAIAYQYESGLFHNGFMGTLVKTGLPGLLCTLLFFGCISKLAAECVRSLRNLDRPWTAFERLTLVIAAQWFSLVIFFYVIHGDAGVWAHTFMLPAALVLVCRRKLLEEAAEPETA